MHNFESPRPAEARGEVLLLARAGAQLNFRQSKFFSLGQIFVGFVRQIGLSTRRIDFLVCHGSYLLKLLANSFGDIAAAFAARHRMPRSIARRMSERF